MSNHGTRVLGDKRALATPISLRMLSRGPRPRRKSRARRNDACRRISCRRWIKITALDIWQIIGWGWSSKPLFTFVTKVLVVNLHRCWTNQTLLRGMRFILLLVFFRLGVVHRLDWIGNRIGTWKVKKWSKIVKSRVENGLKYEIYLIRTGEYLSLRYLQYSRASFWCDLKGWIFYWQSVHNECTEMVLIFHALFECGLVDFFAV